MLYIFILIAVIVISVILRIAAATGLLLPLAYGIIAPTVFSEWFHSNQLLAEGIGWALVAFVALIWVISIIRKIVGMINRYRDEQIAEEVFLYRLRQAKAQGSNAVSAEGLYR